MAANDVEVYGPTTPDKIAALLTAGSVLVGDNISLCSISGSQMVAVVVKSA